MVEGMETAERYPNLDTVRWIVDVSRSGDCVVLDDGSKWHVVPSHRMISGNWPRTMKLQVSPVQGRLYTLSADNEREVQAVYQGFQPIHEEPRPNENPDPEVLPDSATAPDPDQRPPSPLTAESEA